MALFGSMGKARSPFDMSGTVYRTPGIGDGLPNVEQQPMDMGDMTPGMGQPQMDMPQKKPGFFGEGGVGRGIAGSIGDFLLQNAGGQPIYAPMVRDQRQMQMQEQMYERRQKDDWTKWTAQQDYERANPKPYRWESNDGSLMEMGQDGVRQVYKDPVPKIEWVNVKNPDGTMTIMPRPTGQPAPSMNGAPALPQTLTDDDWGDVGGAGPQTPRRFP